MLDRAGADFAGADASDVADFGGPDLAVADCAGVGGLGDGVDDGLDQSVVDDYVSDRGVLQSGPDHARVGGSAWSRREPESGEMVGTTSKRWQLPTRSNLLLPRHSAQSALAMTAGRPYIWSNRNTLITPVLEPG